MKYERQEVIWTMHTVRLDCQPKHQNTVFFRLLGISPDSTIAKNSSPKSQTLGPKLDDLLCGTNGTADELEADMNEVLIKLKGKHRKAMNFFPKK